MVEPFLGFEEAVRGLPWSAADSCRTLGLFAVEVARVTLPCRRSLGGGRDRDAVWSSDRSARARLGGLRLAGGRRRRLSGAARLRGLLFDPPPGLAFGALFGAPISLRFSLLGLDQPLHSFQFPGCLRAGEVATESRVLDVVVAGELAQRLVASAAAKQRLIGYQSAQFGRHSPILRTHQERTRNAPGGSRTVQIISRGGERPRGANHPSERREKRSRKPLSCPHRCLYKQQQETFTSVAER
jgi:hypothetical protein